LNKKSEASILVKINRPIKQHQTQKPKMTKTNFPFIESISQIREAIESTKEKVGKSFYESDKGNHIIFNYRFFTKSTFPNPKTTQKEKEKEYYKLLRECRGIVFDSKTGELVNRPFHKFFNINGELEECSSKYIDLKKKHYWLEKLDGSMISAIYDENSKIRFKTKMG
jgi:RNA ligase